MRSKCLNLLAIRRCLFGLLLGTVCCARLIAATLAMDLKEVHRKAEGFIETGNYTALENLVADIKHQGYDIEQDEPALWDFYEAVVKTDGTANADWQGRFAKLEAWDKAVPDSTAAKIAIAQWHNATAWDARGEGTGDSVNAQAQTTVDQEIAAAKSILSQIPASTVDDPEYYETWIRISLLSGANTATVEDYFNKGVALAKDYLPLYSSTVKYLLPKWYGGAGEVEAFINKSANNFPPEKADIFYAYMTYGEASDMVGNFFTDSSLDYNRMKKGYFQLLGGDTPAQWHREIEFREWVHENDLDFMALLKDDRPLGKTLCLDLEGTAYYPVFDGKDYYTHWRKRSGAEAAFQKELQLEKAGKLDQAEKTLLSFCSNPSIYSPLSIFYERQGMKDKLAAMTIVISGKTPGDALNTPIDQATPETLGETSSNFAMMGEWDKAEAAAKKFDSIRPYNLIGKNVMLLCAINSLDATAAKTAIQSIINMQTDKPSYQLAQQVLSGNNSWEEVKKSMNANDIYLVQGVTAMALYYVAKGDVNEADKLIDFALPRCNENGDKAFLESLEFGSLSRSMKLLAKPSPTPTPATTPAASPSPAASGTN
jgi:hypothetical protein